MPTYVYKCTEPECSSATPFEVKHPMTESWDGGSCLECLNGIEGHNPEGDCRCPGTLKRVFTPTPAHFKGQGWAKMPEYKAKKSS